MSLKQWMRLVCLIVWLGLVFPAASAASVFHACHRTSAPLTIDGVLDEKDWAAAARIDLFDLVTGARPGLSSSARMLWDDEWLYLAFEFADTNVWARARGRDEPARAGFKAYTENSAKVYLDPDGDGRNYTEMHVSPSGLVNDKWQSAPWKAEARAACNLSADEKAEAHWEWNCEGMRSAVVIRGTLNQAGDSDQGWTIEAAIPFASLKQFAGKSACPPKADDTWRVHLGRRYQIEGEDPAKAAYWTWPVLGVPDCHNPDRWGYVVFSKDAHPALPDDVAALPKAEFQWKMLWVRPEQTRTPEAIRKMVEDAVRMKFTAIAAEPVEGLAAAAHAKGLTFFAWMLNLRGGSEMKAFLNSHPDHAQKPTARELALSGQPRMNPDRDNVSTGNWQCPDRGLLDLERQQIEAFLGKQGADGIALDYIGYRNYYACFCAYSEAGRRQYAQEHLELTAAQVLWKYSEASLARYVEQVRAAAKAVKPDAELAIHVYPDFDPAPLYTHRLPIEYWGQTVSWFYEPFWPLPTVADVTLRGKAAAGGRSHPFCRFVPFVGAYAKFPKTPEQLRREIRVAGLAGSNAIMVAFYETFLNDPALARVLEEEL